MKSNILIVEDHELTRFGLKTAFESCDFIDKIYEAESAEKGLEIATEQEINLIIMDLGLPGMNGIEATKRIKDLNRFCTWNRTVINIPRKQNAIRFLDSRSMENLRQNVFLILDHRKFIDSFSDVKIG